MQRSARQCSVLQCHGKESMRKKRKDNRGSSMVMVIVAMAFVGMLVSVILYMSLLNYRIKMADVKNKDSFYSAENALDEIKAGLEQEISKALGSAYLTVMENYTLYSDAGRSEEFAWQYVNTLRDALKVPGADNKYQVSILTSYLRDTAWDAENQTGARISAATDSEGVLLVRTDGVVLKDVLVTYVGSDGNISRIKTDIRLALPDIAFNESFKMPDILSYCAIANERLDINNGNSSLVGSIYGGREGIFVENASIRMSGADLIVTDKLIHVKNASLTIDPDSNLWVEGIDVDSASLNMGGSAYVRDDLTINGDWSDVTVSSTYYGYGTGEEGKDAYRNSAIIINGLHTTLDMSYVNRMYLAGHAYVKSAGTVSISGSDVANKNVLMGESLAVKSDQLAYLVPVECLWVKDGENLCNTNPVPVEKIAQYESIGATEVDLDAVVGKLDVPLSNYASGFQKVYRNADGVQLVYYYLTFDSELSANRFFKTWYEADKERMDGYLKVYVKKLLVPTDSMLRVNLAGNIFTMENGQFELKEATVATDDGSLLMQESEGYAATFTQLCTILSRTEPTTVQKTEKETNGIFYNVVNRSAFEKVVPAIGDKKVWYDAENNEGIVIVNNGAEPYRLSADTGVVWDKIRILVASGDVIVDRNFKGIIIAGGDVRIQGVGSLVSDPEGVSRAMQITGEISTGEFMALNLFVDGSYVFNENPTGASGGTVSVGELVRYENWSKE